jgi:predicted Fe-S protein YdhL (DUF1289 family)
MTAAEFPPTAQEHLVAIKSIAACARSISASGLNDHEDVPSPCVSICRVDADSGWCDGCLRTLGEISAWSRLDSDTKRGVWKIIEQRAAVSLAALDAKRGEAP